jgi:hypothetical protein
MNALRHRLAVGIAAIAVVLLAGCSSAPKTPPSPPPQPELPPIKQPEVSPQERARLHTELGAGYYERGQMDVALDELGEAVKLDPGNARIYNIYGLVTPDGRKSRPSRTSALALARKFRDPPELGLVSVHHRRARESMPGSGCP